jgi:hypothetical protein
LYDKDGEGTAAHLSDSPSLNVSQKLDHLPTSTTASLTLFFSLQTFESISCFLSYEHIFTNEYYSPLNINEREHISDLEIWCSTCLDLFEGFSHSYPAILLTVFRCQLFPGIYRPFSPRMAEILIDQDSGLGKLCSTCRDIFNRWDTFVNRLKVSAPKYLIYHDDVRAWIASADDGCVFCFRMLDNMGRGRAEVLRQTCHLTALGPLSSCIYTTSSPSTLSRPYIYPYFTVTRP